MPQIDQTDPAAAGCAQAVVAAITARYEGLIAEISENQGLSEMQKAAAIVGLRYQQANETADAAQAIIEQARTGQDAQPRTMRKEQSSAQDAGDAAPPCENSGSSSDSKNSTTPGAIRGLFRAAFKDVTRRAENPPPKPRRRRGETDKGVVTLFPTIPRRLARTGAVARGRYAGLQPASQEAQEPAAPANAYDRAALYLSDTLDWLTLWQDNGDQDHWLDDEVSTNQNRNIFQL